MAASVTTSPKVITSVVYNDTTTVLHTPMTPADKIAGSLLQLSKARNNTLKLGADGGLEVKAKQTEYGSVESSPHTGAGAKEDTVLFTTPFTTPPFVTTVASTMVADVASSSYNHTARVGNITTTGFTIQRQATGVDGILVYPAFVWKAEEK